MGEFADPGRTYDTSYAPRSAMTDAYQPPVRAQADPANDTIVSARRDIDAIPGAIELVRRAHAANDPKAWVAAKQALDRRIADAQRVLASARTRVATASPESVRGLSEADQMLSALEDAAGALAEAPLGWVQVSREQEILAILDAPMNSAHDGWAQKEAPLEAAFDQLSPAESAVISRRLKEQHAGDPVAAALAPNLRITRSRFDALLAHLAGARKRQAMQAVGGSDIEPSNSKPETASAGAAAASTNDLLRQALEVGGAGRETQLEAVFAALDGTERRALVSRLESYRPGSGDDVAARFVRLDDVTRQRLLAALRDGKPATLKDVAPTFGSPVHKKSDDRREMLAYFVERMTEQRETLERHNEKTDPLFVVARSHLDFSTRAVGSETRMTVAIQNAEGRRLALDQLIPVANDPFSELTVEPASSLVFDPGEVREITIAYRPARALRTTQTFRLIANGVPVGPEADITVSGEGSNLFEGVDGVRIQAQRDEAALARGDRLEDRLSYPRASARERLEAWSNAAKELNASIAEWTVRNWTVFYGKTGRDAGVVDMHAVAGVIEKVVKKGAKSGSKSAIKAFAQVARSEASAGLVAGASSEAAQLARGAMYAENIVVGLVVDKAIDIFGSWVLDKLGVAPPTADERELAASEHVASESIDKSVEIGDARLRANAVVDDTDSAAALRIEQASSANELEQWIAWAQDQSADLPKPVDKNDLTLSNHLLAEWVMQHAETPSSPIASTNKAAWKQAKAELHESGELETLERSDLFVHQCLHEWSSLGLDGAEEAAASLSNRVAEIARHPWRLDEVDGSAVQRWNLADGVYFHRSVDPKRTADTLGAGEPLLSETGRGEAVFSNEFSLRCGVSLVREDGAIYVRVFSYELESRYLGTRSDRYPYIGRSVGQTS